MKSFIKGTNFNEIEKSKLTAKENVAKDLFFNPEVVADIHFELVYTCIIDYAMNDEEYVIFLRKYLRLKQINFYQ